MTPLKLLASLVATSCDSASLASRVISYNSLRSSTLHHPHPHPITHFYSSWRGVTKELQGRITFHSGIVADLALMAAQLLRMMEAITPLSQQLAFQNSAQNVVAVQQGIVGHLPHHCGVIIIFITNSHHSWDRSRWPEKAKEAQSLGRCTGKQGSWVDGPPHCYHGQYDHWTTWSLYSSSAYRGDQSEAED